MPAARADGHALTQQPDAGRSSPSPGSGYPLEPGSAEIGPAGLDILILARNEETILDRSLACLQPMLEANDRLHVVADHCLDRTAEIAGRYGVEVHRRLTGTPGKGRALAWWLSRTQPSDGRGILVLDADSRVTRFGLAAVRRRLRLGQRAIQMRVAPLFHSSNPIASLAALSDEVEQRVFEAVKHRLGWPIRLRGTGMAFERNTLQGFADRLQSTVEDAELTLLLAADGVDIHPAPESTVFDPKPIDAMAATRQRARWLQGQLHLARIHPDALIRLVRRGPAGWSLLGSVLLKPRTLVLPIKLALAVIGLSLAATRPFSLALLAPLAADLLALALGLAIIGGHRRRHYLRALTHAGAYFGMWTRSARLAFVSQDPWLRARPSTVDGSMSESSTAGV